MVDALLHVQSPTAPPAKIVPQRYSTSSPTAAPQATARAATARVATAPAVVQQDKVTLSAGAQAHQLFHQGKSVAEIAAALGTTTSSVDTYLGIATAETAVPATAPTTLPVGPAASQAKPKAI